MLSKLAPVFKQVSFSARLSRWKTIDGTQPTLYNSETL